NFINSFVGTYIESDRDCECKVRFESIQNVKIYVTGKETEKNTAELIQGPVSECIFNLKKGLNDFLFQPSFFHHLHDYSFAFWTEGKLEWTINSKTSRFALIGPFELPEFVKDFAYNDFDDIQNYCCPSKPDFSEYEEYLKNPLIETYKGTDLYKEIDMELCPLVSPYFQSYTDVIVEENNNDYSYLIGNNTWTKIEPNEKGDVRILLDYGSENTGYQTFEVNGPKDVILDFHNFEFIQPDGMYNYAEGMRNSIRYVTGEGRQSYQSLYRRGFQYSYLTVRNLKEPLYIRNINLLISSAQNKNEGYFYCSDYKLNKIFEACVRSARNCSEDTLTDCPTYEQTSWLGDAMIISQIDFLMNGNTKAFYRNLILGGQSLERSEMTESQVPSGWQNNLSLVVYYWMVGCGIYYNFTGDKEGAEKLIPYLQKNFEGIRNNINEFGLFEKRIWNMCDWALTDTPVRGIVTFVQFVFSKALMDNYDFAKKLGYDFPEWKELSVSLKENAYKYMWNEEKQAFTDCLRRAEGRLVMSDVYSQQTHTFAYMAETSQEKKELLENYVFNPPADFVKKGSPAFVDFILQLYIKQNRTDEVLDVIKNDWGFMLDKGATTFWEMWTLGNYVEGSRLTRSHCHGYASIPAYYLIDYVLGIKPKKAGYEEIIIEPHLGDLAWARGAISTKFGRVEVQAEKDEKGELKIKV
ncbi:MAG: hypothetical protein KBT47_03545, partial [Armatimonadetes bacterium]|nr:hypothetical protein [Candidatus Hippobium faecium]